jgi:histone-binding protein RBBP4
MSFSNNNNNLSNKSPLQSTTTTTTSSSSPSPNKKIKTSLNSNNENNIINTTSTTTNNNNDIEETYLIAEEMRVWRKNAPFLYDFVLERELSSCSQTLQWLPTLTRGSEMEDFNKHHLLYGTQGGNEDTDVNFLYVAQVLLPKEDAVLNSKYFDEENGELAGYAQNQTKFSVVRKIPHDGDVERARYMPQNYSIVASRMRGGDIGIFNLFLDDSSNGSTTTTTTTTECMPELRLKGHSNVGYGLDWSLLNRGKLLSCSPRDTRVLLWDVEESKKSPTINNPPCYINTDGLVRSHVFDCAFHPLKIDIVGTVSVQIPGEFGKSEMCIWDLRTSKEQPKSSSKIAGDLNCIRFSPLDENILASGGETQVVHIWDLRKIEQPVHVLSGHTGEIYQVAWSPFHSSVIASCGTDRRVNCWDLDRIGMEQSPEDAEDGDPELLFIHGGHGDTVTDISWNETDEWVAASVSVDGILQIWEANDTVLGDDDGEDDVVGEVVLE